MAKRKKYTQEQKDEVIFLFKNTSENSVRKISEITSLSKRFVSITIDEHFKNKFNNK